MSERWSPREVQVQLLGSLAGILVGAAIGVMAGEGWYGVALMGGFIAGNAGVKALRPSSSISKDVSWIGLLSAASMVLAAIYLFENPQVLGSWTIVVVFGVFFVYGLISLVVSARSRANGDGASHDGAD